MIQKDEQGTLESFKQGEIVSPEEGCGWKNAMGNRLIVLRAFCGGIVVRFC